MIGVVSG
jgi:hypothetical protein